MPPLTGKAALVVGVHRTRRCQISEKLRGAKAVVVEAMTAQQAYAALRQIRFDFLLVDFSSPTEAMRSLLEDLCAEDPEAHVFVVGPPVDSQRFGRLLSPDLTNLGFGNARDAIGEALSTVLAEADDRKNVGTHGAAAATSRSAEPNGRQEQTITLGRNAGRCASKQVD